jgi:hypothetical protein
MEKNGKSFKVEKIAAIGSIHAPKFTCYLERHN